MLLGPQAHQISPLSPASCSACRWLNRPQDLRWILHAPVLVLDTPGRRVKTAHLNRTWHVPCRMQGHHCSGILREPA